MERRGSGSIEPRHTILPGRARAARPGALPHTGDLILSPQSAPQQGFALSQVPGGVQLRFARGDTAAELAQRFAEIHCVDVWEERDGRYALLASYRRDWSPDNRRGDA